MDQLDAMRLVMLCFIGGLTALIGGYSLGESAGELITWFDAYADDTKTEGD